MKLGVISDMHGNAVALEAVLAELDRAKCDRIVCLGDAVQGGPQPVRVVELLRERRIPTVMGNADDWLLRGFVIQSESISGEKMRQMSTAREWSLSQLSQSDIGFIESFVPTFEIDLPASRKLLLFHGSPKSYDDIILPDSPFERLKELLPRERATFFAGGHVHTQFVRHLRRGFFFNPGSVGFPHSHRQGDEPLVINPYAEFAVFEVDDCNLSLQFRRLDYDIQDLFSVYRSSGRPYAENEIAAFG